MSFKRRRQGSRVKMDSEDISSETIHLSSGTDIILMIPKNLKKNQSEISQSADISILVPGLNLVPQRICGNWVREAIASGRALCIMPLYAESNASMNRHFEDLILTMSVLEGRGFKKPILYGHSIGAVAVLRASIPTENRCLKPAISVLLAPPDGRRLRLFPWPCPLLRRILRRPQLYLQPSYVGKDFTILNDDQAFLAGKDNSYSRFFSKDTGFIPGRIGKDIVWGSYLDHLDFSQIDTIISVFSVEDDNWFSDSDKFVDRMFMPSPYPVSLSEINQGGHFVFFEEAQRNRPSVMDDVFEKVNHSLEYASY